MREEELSLETGDGPMPAFEVHPEGDAHGGVIVVQEAFGITEHIRDVTRRLATAGWHALAPAFFHRQGSPVFSYDDIPAVLPVMGELTAHGLTDDLYAAIGHLEAAGYRERQIGVVGFCMGGSVSFYAATFEAIGAAVTFYGGGVREGRFGLSALVELAPSLQAPWLGLFGDLDKGIPVEQVEELRVATESAPVPTEIVRYPDADHGFNCNDRPAVFNATAAEDAWRRTLAWFDEHLRADSAAA